MLQCCSIWIILVMISVSLEKCLAKSFNLNRVKPWTLHFTSQVFSLLQLITSLIFSIAEPFSQLLSLDRSAASHLHYIEMSLFLNKYVVLLGLLLQCLLSFWLFHHELCVLLLMTHLLSGFAFPFSPTSQCIILSNRGTRKVFIMLVCFQCSHVSIPFLFKPINSLSHFISRIYCYRG